MHEFMSSFLVEISLCPYKEYITLLKVKLLPTEITLPIYIISLRVQTSQFKFMEQRTEKMQHKNHYTTYKNHVQIIGYKSKAEKTEITLKSNNRTYF